MRMPCICRTGLDPSDLHSHGYHIRLQAPLHTVTGLDPSDVHSDGYTPLHRSCWGGEQRHTDMAKVLLAAGTLTLTPTQSLALALTLTRYCSRRAGRTTTLVCMHPGYHPC